MTEETKCTTPSQAVESEAGEGMHSSDRTKRSLSGFTLRAGQRRKRRTKRTGLRKTTRKSSRR
jgi:hypothetical protein